MSPTSLLVASIAVISIGCGGAPAPAAPVEAHPAATSATAPTPAPITGCDGRNTPISLGHPKERPSSDWKTVGRLEIVVRAPAGKEGEFVSYEVKDRSGKVVEKKPLPKTNERDFKRVLAEGACRVGGGVVVANEASPNDNELEAKGGGTILLDVLAPPSEDEHADLTRLCTKPAGFTSAGDPNMDLLGSHHELRWLTTRAWRGFVEASYDIDVDSKNTDQTEHQRAWARAVRARGDELATISKSKGFATCWFVDVLHGVK
jgi:hypothetical protein